MEQVTFRVHITALILVTLGKDHLFYSFSPSDPRQVFAFIHLAPDEKINNEQHELC